MPEAAKDRYAVKIIKLLLFFLHGRINKAKAMNKTRGEFVKSNMDEIYRCCYILINNNRNQINFHHLYDTYKKNLHKLYKKVQNFETS